MLDSVQKHIVVSNGAENWLKCKAILSQHGNHSNFGALVPS